ncbi:Rab proteins geranylgeranyltransferase component A 1 [Stylophora pistillata]|uniref:Rab proteins geranylgeranyltransferase component A 1 n=1 Tax=Stylophora pistillata TaxID=50429 RepID=A0A2B4S0H1_STYPI|nr:Rab proteins geranylgeranyltransferase component A 1 [Stylophora pistillata]
MAEDKLPEEFDVIVLGTGFPESVVAASLSRVGLKVLHLDRNDYYSGQWATFTFDNLLKWIELNQGENHGSGSDKSGTHDNEPPSLESGTFSVPVPSHSDTISNVMVRSYFSEKKTEQDFVLSGSKEDTTLEIAASSTEAQKSDETKEVKPDPSGENNSSKVTTGVEESSNEAEDFRDRPANDSNERLDTSDINSTTCSSQLGESNGTPHSEEESSDKDLKDENHDEELPAVTDSRDGQDVSFVSPLRQGREKKPAICPDMTYDDLKPYWRRFNIDVSPKLLFSRGPLVEALISANISHYAEFKTVTRILTYMNGQVEEVPCSRADVFSSSAISVVEKRMLMKFLTFCLDFKQQQEQYEAYENKPFGEFLQSRRLTPNLQHFIIHAIAMVKPETATVIGLKATQNFLQSLGRYGNTPFIWPLYGAGELPQAFCRMCAVFGGLYCLRRSASEITINKENGKCTGVISDNQLLKCKWLIMEHSYVPDSYKKECHQLVSRGVFITCSSLKISEEECVSVLSVPPSSEGEEPVRVIQLGSASMACPNGLYVVHLVSKGVTSAKDDLEATANKLFHFPSEGNVDSDKPTVLWSLYFNQLISDSSCVGDLPGNVHVLLLPGMSLGFGEALQQAKEVFEKICPDEEFLQPVPNPEDIILDDFLQDPNHNAAQTDLGDQQNDDSTSSGEGRAVYEQAEGGDSGDGLDSQSVEEGNGTGTGATPSEQQEPLADE